MARANNFYARRLYKLPMRLKLVGPRSPRWWAPWSQQPGCIKILRFFCDVILTNLLVGRVAPQKCDIRAHHPEGGVDPQSVVNFLKDIKGYPTHLDVRGNST